MLTVAYFQDADDLFDPVAGLNDPGVVASFRTGLRHARELLMNARIKAQPGGVHEEMCFYFQAGTGLLMALLDGMAVYVEKKVAVPSASGRVCWAGATTFVDPRFATLRAIQRRTTQYVLKGGITANTLRNFSKHYLPWVPLSGHAGDGLFDIMFPIDPVTKSGPVLSGLLFPLFPLFTVNDAREAYLALGRLLGQTCDEADVHAL